MNLPYSRHVLICVGPRCGGERGSMRIRQEFRKEFVRQGIDTSVKDTECLCFGLCTYGPNVILYPDGVVYSGVKPSDVAEIVRRHVKAGQTVERLLFKKKEAPPPPADEDDFGPLPGEDPAPTRG
jgi:NADH-quinone oxidoreductase subunit F